ncbi:MAG: malonate decarboxylase subunit epsilon [Actinobacteria bacterium]|nr:malonate decarboxylase subunit epsilon [Actinomycetota bacterium]
MSVAFLFPGQGSQRPGMLHDLPDHPAARGMTSQATEVLGRDVLDLDTPEALGSTIAAQLALLVVGATAARILVEEGGGPDFVAGHSVGAFAAAVAAGALAYPDALRLVDLRARAMQKAYPRGYGMGVVVGLDERTMSRLAAESGTPKAPVHAANVNAPLQVGVSGAEDAMERVLDLAREHGARRAHRLAVPTPSHTPLMAPVAAELRSALADVPMDLPTVPYLSNVGGRALRDPEEIRDDLARSVERPVRWHDATTLLFELGVRLFVELPPGRVLTDLATAAFPEARAVAVADAGVGSAATLIARHRSERGALR